MKRIKTMQVSNYYNNQNNNTLVRTNRGDVWFSYKTPIAFRTLTTGLVISENEWGPTTGKHLNSIDSDKSKRIKRADFMDQLTNADLN